MRGNKYCQVAGSCIVFPHIIDECVCHRVLCRILLIEETVRYQRGCCSEKYHHSINRLCGYDHLPCTLHAPILLLLLNCVRQYFWLSQDREAMSRHICPRPSSTAGLGL